MKLRKTMPLPLKVDVDGVIRVGYAQALPYSWITGGMGIFPGLEASGRYTEISNIDSNLGPDFGANKDKAFDLKYQLFPEYKQRPVMLHH